MNIDKRQFLGLFAAYAMTGFKIESILASMNLIYQNPILRIQYMDLMDWEEEKFERIFTNFNKNRESLVINNIENFMYKMYINNMDVTKRLEFFKKYLTPSQDEVKLFGEVFTPIPLIEEMLDKLPKDVWSNKDLKWLDPANGIGNFPIIIFLKLMVGLKDVIINEEDRKKHILENMLYMVDISPKNTFLCYNIFDPESKYNLNIHKGDFLECDLNEIFGIDKFDIIVGNPPYQSGSNKIGRGGKTIIWNKFVKKIIENVLLEKGYLCVLHPPTWRSGQSKINKSIGNALKEGTFLTLNTSAETHFNVASWIDYYIWKKEKNINQIETLIINNNTTIYKNISTLPIISKTTDELAWSILEKTAYSNLPKINICYSDERVKTEKIKIDEFVYPYKKASQDIIYYGNKKHSLQDNFKVYMSNLISGSGKVYIGKDYGEVGVFTGFVTLCTNQLSVDNYYTYFNTKLVKFLFKIFMFSGFVNGAVTNLLPNVMLNQNEKWTTSTIYENLNLTSDEIRYLENAV